MKRKNLLISFAVSTLLFSNIANAKINKEDKTISNDEIKSAKEIKLENKNITIDKTGVYLFSGKLDNQNITVDVKDDEIVKIILDGVNIKSSNEPAIYVKNADKTVVFTTKGSKNVLEDSSNNSQSAVIYSKDDLVILGEGLLDIKANKNDGIKSNDELYLNANINVDAIDDGIIGKESVIVDGGNYKIVSNGKKGDGLKSSNNEDKDKGFIEINGGSFDINVKDDAIHAEQKLIINEGKIIVANSYESLEANEIEINGGYMNLLSNDDTINGAGGSNPLVTINCGTVIIDSEGDGIDVNGDLIITGGTVIVNGPTTRGNGPLDFDGDFKISGGVLVATESSGMAAAPGNNSTQYSFLIELTPSVEAGTILNVREKDGKQIFSFDVSKKANNITFSSSKIKDETTYEIYVGGSDSSKKVDGLYLEPLYKGGTLLKTFTTSGISTSDVKRKGKGGKPWYHSLGFGKTDEHKSSNLTAERN